MKESGYKLMVLTNNGNLATICEGKIIEEMEKEKSNWMKRYPNKCFVIAPVYELKDIK